MSAGQWIRTLLIAAALVAALLFVMTRLTGGPGGGAPRPPAGQAAAPAPVEEVEIQARSEPEQRPAEENKPEPEPEPTPEPAPEPEPEPTPEPEPEHAPEIEAEPTPEPTPEPAPEREPEPTSEPEPAPRPEPAPEREPEPTPEPEAAPAPERTPEPAPEPDAQAEPAPEPGPESAADAEPDAEAGAAALRRRLDERAAGHARAMEAMERRAADIAPERLATRLAGAMTGSLEAADRAAEAAADLETAETARAPEALRADIAADAGRQRAGAERLGEEFDRLRRRAAAGRAPPRAYAGTARLGRAVVEHRAAAAMPVAEARRMLSAVGADEAMYIRSLRWNGQAARTRELWISMGATYALLPPRGSFAPVWRIPGGLGAGAEPVEIDQDAFFDAYSNRFTWLTAGDGAAEMRAIEARLLRKCPCRGYRLTLVWNWDTLAVILSDARALARAKGLAVPRDIKTVEWLVAPGSGAGRARVDIVRLIGRDGAVHEP